MTERELICIEIAIKLGFKLHPECCGTIEEQVMGLLECLCTGAAYASLYKLEPLVCNTCKPLVENAKDNCHKYFDGMYRK